ncbi:MAG: type I glyceraldehyde-3-phosphate dehydrogenase [Thermoanaerobaculia bacterium]
MSPLARVGIFGFGRIGRNLLRILSSHAEVEIGAIADLADARALEYLFRFDTLLGRFPGTVALQNGRLNLPGREIPMITGKDQSPIPNWGDLGVETVFESTSKGRTRGELERHLAAGARRVIALAPPLDPPDITCVMGVNDGDLKSSQRIVSNASSTVHSLAPVAAILDEAFGIRRAFFTTVHSYTSHHRLADVPSKDMRLGRAAAENIIPEASRSPEVLMGLLPRLRGKVTGVAMSVPVSNGSLVDLVCWHDSRVTAESVNEAVRSAASSDRWKKYLAYETDPIVSSDVALSQFSGIFDCLATMAVGEHVSKTICWFDSGFGYAHRAVDLLERFAALDAEAP